MTGKALGSAEHGFTDAVEREVKALAGGNIHRRHHAAGDNEHAAFDRSAAFDDVVSKVNECPAMVPKY